MQFVSTLVIFVFVTRILDTLPRLLVSCRSDGACPSSAPACAVVTRIGKVTYHDGYDFHVLRFRCLDDLCFSSSSFCSLDLTLCRCHPFQVSAQRHYRNWKASLFNVEETVNRSRMFISRSRMHLHNLATKVCFSAIIHEFFDL